VIGIANGGLNISIPIAKILKLPHKSVTIRFYANENKSSETPKEVNFEDLKDLDPSSNILFVDDLIDGCHTVNYLKQNIKFKHKIAVLYYNKNDFNIIPEYYCYEKPDKWLEFYWEI
jgi:hypoxanthine phosphoribosyltransferase